MIIKYPDNRLKYWLPFRNKPEEGDAIDVDILDDDAHGSEADVSWRKRFKQQLHDESGISLEFKTLKFADLWWKFRRFSWTNKLGFHVILKGKAHFFLYLWYVLLPNVHIKVLKVFF